MNQAEYEALYRKARKSYPRLTRETFRKIQATYKNASNSVASVIQDAQLSGKSQLTINSQQAIQQQLDEAAAAINLSVGSNINVSLGTAIDRTAKINIEYLSDTVAAVGTSKITAAGLNNMYVGINERVIESMINRIYQDGYRFSERVWRNGIDYQNKIKSVITEGLAQGRSTLQVARDVQVYTVKGKRSLINRYGPNLERGTKAFARRIGNRIDSRALRLVTSELNASLQEAAAEQGRANPASNGWYDWVLEAGRQSWPCTCPDLAADSPYKFEDIPGYPHPRCFPGETKIMTPEGEKEIQDIKAGDFVISHDGTVQRIKAIFKSIYDGDLIKISTKERDITSTENHSLLSNDRWCRAKNFKPGFNITCISSDIKSFSLIKSISNNDPSKRFNKRGFFRIMFYLYGGSVPITAIDFNGKLYIREGEIDIEFIDGKIRNWVFTDFNQGVEKHLFIGRSNLSGIRLGSFKKFFVRSFASSHGVMCGASIGNSSIGVTSNSTFRISRRHKSKADKIFVDSPPANSHDFRNTIYREIIIPEKFDKKPVINNNFSTHNRSIVTVIKKRFKGIVYNLSIENTNTYIANGFIVHNCRCDVRPNLRSNKEFTEDLKTWVDGGKVDYIDDWYYSTYVPAQ